MPQGKCSQPNRARRTGSRLRRTLGLAPRAVVLMSCSCALALAAVAGYGATLPGMVEAREERTPHIERKGESSLGTTTGYVWARVLDGTLFAPSGAAGADGSDAKVTLENGTTILISSIKGTDALAATSVSKLVASAEKQLSGQQGQGGSSSKDTSTSTGDHAGAEGGTGGQGTSAGGASSGSGSGSGSDGGSNSGGSTGGGSGSSDARPRPSAEEENNMHAWLVAKANALNGYVARVNAAVSTYNATGDTSACDNLANELFFMRGEFGRQTFSPQSVWYSQFSNLWGAYTHLDIYVGHYGEDAGALATFNEKVAAIAL